MTAKQEGKTIPDDWALNVDGKPTSDPAEALKGAMFAFGDAKGSSLALMIEILSVALTSSTYAFKATLFWRFYELFYW